MAHSTRSSSGVGDLPHPASNQWHTLTPQRAIALLESSPEGLSASEVERRQQVYGPNELQEGASRSPWQILLDQFKNIMLLMLIAVALVSLVLDLRRGGFPKDAIAIFAIVLLNGLLGYLQESKAEKALAALKGMTSPRVRVFRQGQEQEIDATALVPGQGKRILQYFRNKDSFRPSCCENQRLSAGC